MKNLNTVKSINNSYNEFVVTNKDTNIYNVDKEIIGSIDEGFYLELDSFKAKSKTDQYFKLKDSDYYIYYSDVSKTDQMVASERSDYYVEIGKSIIINNPSTLYQDDKKISINDELSFDVISQDDAFYYINYLNQNLKVNKSDIKEENLKSLDGIASYISVINYNNVSDSCDSRECVTTDQLKEQLGYLKENNFYSISIDDYKLWVNDSINLKENAVLITSNSDLSGISSEFGFNIQTDLGGLSFSDSDSKSEKGVLSRYNIISKTDIDVFKQIANGESVAYIELPVQQVHSLPSLSSNATEIAVLNYHFFYDPQSGESCPDGNCKTVQDFERELAYLKENNYKALTMDEFTKWMYGEIELPARSVLITIDDGAMGTGTHNGNKLIPLLEKYQTHATLFLITGWWPIGNYSSPYLDIESHTYNMHEGNFCENAPRGSKLLCSSHDEVFDDLKTSAEITGSKNAFCFPMYVYNDTTLQVLDELGFKLAFVGGDYKASRNNNKYQVPRYHIYSETSLDQFINMIS